MKGAPGKKPAFQFYVKDWLTDPAVSQLSFSSKGLWIDILCYMWLQDPDDQGVLEGTVPRLAKLLNTTPDHLENFLFEAEELDLCDIEKVDKCKMSALSVEVDTSGAVLSNVRIINRRMIKETKQRKQWRKQKRRQRSRGPVHPESEQRPGVSPTPYPYSSNKEGQNGPAKTHPKSAGPRQDSRSQKSRSWKHPEEPNPKSFEIHEYECPKCHRIVNTLERDLQTQQEICRDCWIKANPPIKGAFKPLESTA